MKIKLALESAFKRISHRLYLSPNTNTHNIHTLTQDQTMSSNIRTICGIIYEIATNVQEMKCGFIVNNKLINILINIFV